MVVETPILMQPPMLTVKQVAQRLNTSERNVRYLISNGQLTGIKVGKELRIEPAELEAFIERNKRGRKE